MNGDDVSLVYWCWYWYWYLSPRNSFFVDSEIKNGYADAEIGSVRGGERIVFFLVFWFLGEGGAFGFWEGLNLGDEDGEVGRMGGGMGGNDGREMWLEMMVFNFLLGILF